MLVTSSRAPAASADSLGGPPPREGKRGGTRIIYFVLDEEGVIYLLTIFDKDEMTDLGAREKRLLKQLVDAEKEARRARRQKGRPQ
ncbi:MAG: hypothetical protein Q8O67_29020 [Deltaproteobacteria bacterium]|nr:hypothetical protein [Deltaproteobacteria bacterium]